MGRHDAARLRGDAAADVPCGGCTACCTASQFVHVDPDETDALAHIPRDVLFPAPGLPPGHVLMGYDEHGACPMFVDGGCSIYEHRPRACRIYDCRIFAATGVDVADDGTTAVAARVRRWRFAYTTPDDAALERSMHRAATFLDEHPECAETGTTAHLERDQPSRTRRRDRPALHRRRAPIGERGARGDRRATSAALS